VNKISLKLIKEFLYLFYLKLFRINDSPERVALGLGVGVAVGLFPGTGPLAALFLAFVFRLNRAAALLGSLASNTWLSIVAFLLSIKVGALIMGLNWQEVRQQPILKVILPVLLGYFVVAFCLGLVVYLITLAILKLKPRYKLYCDGGRKDL
jgi:hypothetical protein